MATITKRDLKVFADLAVVKLEGYEPDPEPAEIPDRPGSANWLVEKYGMQPDTHDPDPEHPGIIWTDYDAPARHPWTFSVLIASDEVEDLTRLAREAGYEILGVEAVAEPTHYGDGGGTVAILKHPDGWCVLPS